MDTSDLAVTPSAAMARELLDGATISSIGPLALVIENDGRMRAYLRAILGAQRFRVLEAESGAQGLARAGRQQPDVVILGHKVPDFDAIAVTTKLREWTSVPILVLSESDTEHDKIAALDAGANDFVTKPFHTGELLARIRVWLRYAQRPENDTRETIITVGELGIDFVKRIAYARGKEVRMTPTQYKLFAAMMRSAGRILTHEQILLMVWGPAYGRQTQYLRVYMGKLRQLLEVDPAHPRYFVTEPRIGYRLRTD